MTVPPSDSSRDPARDDELFRQIVAGYAEEPTDPVPRWPVSEDLSDDASGDRPVGRQPEAAAPPPPSYPVPGVVPEEEALPGWVEPAPIEDDGHFEPPEPPRLPRPRLRTLGALVLLFAGLGVLFFPYELGLDDSPISMLFGILLSVGGGGLLVLGMRDAPGHDDDPEGGAVV